MATKKTRSDLTQTSEASVVVGTAEGPYLNGTLCVQIVEFKSKTFFSQKKYW
jgi:hypothetical protein